MKSKIFLAITATSLLFLGCQKGINALTSSSGFKSSVKTSNKIFITNAAYQGNLGGISGANETCFTAARAAGLDGTWMAWVSTSTSNVIDRVRSEGPWTFVGGETVAFQNLAQFATDPTFPIMVNEYGVTLNDGDDFVWTGTYQGGTVNSNFSNCSDWTSTSGEAQYGRAMYNNFHWTQDNHTSCASSFHLICIEQ